MGTGGNEISHQINKILNGRMPCIKRQRIRKKKDVKKKTAREKKTRPSDPLSTALSLALPRRPETPYLQADAFGDHVLHQDVGQRLEVVREPVAVGLGAALFLHQHGQQPRVGPAAAGHAGGRLGRDQRAPDYRGQAVVAAA